MTIRRRLMISNFLMLIIPVLSLLAVSLVMTVFVWTAFDQVSSTQVKAQRFDASLSMMRDLTEQWKNGTTEKDMQKALSEKKWKYIGESISLSIYKEKSPLYTSRKFIEDEIINSALSQQGQVYLVVDGVALYKEDIGEYDIVLTDSSYSPNTGGKGISEAEGQVFLMGNRKYVMIIFIGVILLTNILLTRNVYQNIVTPLETLLYGFGQIRKGNLEYRIRHYGRDEFSDICHSFNDMADKLEAMDKDSKKYNENRKELIAGISHDLRTPLTAIRAYVEGLEEGVAKSPEAKQRYMQIIKTKTSDLEHIVNQLFLFSKLDIGEYPFNITAMDLNYELEDYVSQVRDEYKIKGLIINLDLGEVPAVVLADKMQFRNILTNILENSVKYSDKEKAVMDIKCSVTKKYALISMTDNGPGIEPEALSKMFELFYRADKSRNRPGGGSGLGLSISAKIMERFNGQIFADNAKGGGLKITLLFTMSKIHAGNDRISGQA